MFINATPRTQRRTTPKTPHDAFREEALPGHQHIGVRFVCRSHLSATASSRAFQAGDCGSPEGYPHSEKSLLSPSICPSPPTLLSRTLAFAVTSAPASTRTRTTASCPWYAALCSGVSPSCGAQPRVRNPLLHLPRVLRAPLHLETTFVKKLSRNLTAPRPGALFNLRGRGGGFVAAVVAIRCAHPSQTRPGACSSLKNTNSWTGTPLCSHV